MYVFKKFLSVICIISILFSQFAVLAVDSQNIQKESDKIQNNQSENNLESDLQIYNYDENNAKDEENKNKNKNGKETIEKDDESQSEKEVIEEDNESQSEKEVIEEDNESQSEKEDIKEDNKNQIIQNLKENSSNYILTSGVVGKSNVQIQTGIYKLRSALDKNFVLDISGGSFNNGANVQIWTSANVKQQRFHITNLGDGYYTIVALHSSKALDVSGAGQVNGTNVWQYESNGSDAQKWRIVASSDSSYMFQSKCNGLYLDVSGGLAQNGSNVQVYEGNGTNAQKFLLESVDNIERSQTLSDGAYTIRLANKQNKVLDIDGGKLENGANLQIWEMSNVKQQRFDIKYLGDGYYEIKARHSGKVLDVSGGMIDNGTNVWQYEANGSDAQKWIIRKTSDGFYTIISKLSGSYIQVASSLENGSNVQICDESEEKNVQKFIFEKYEIKSEKIIEDGIYKIRSALNPNFALDISGGSKENGATLQIWTSNNVMQQQFKFTYSKEGYYIISAMHSSKVLDVDNAGKVNGTNIWQYASNGTSAQKWILEKDENGYYSIISQCNELYVDISGGIAANGTNIQMYEGNNSNAQKFILESVEELKHKKTIENGVYKIRTALNTNYVLDISAGSVENKANLQLWKDSICQQQKFSITYLNDGFYEIKALHSAKVFDIAGGIQANKTNIWQYESNGSDAQKWLIQKSKDGYYYIISKDRLYLNVEGKNASNGANINIEFYQNNNAQKFIFEEIMSIEENEYEINTLLKNDMVLDVAGASLESKANIQIWNYTNVNQQMFKFEYKNNGYYIIKAKHSGNVLEVENSTKNGANVYQAEENRSDRQLWKIEFVDKGKYRIKSKFNSLYLDVSGGNKQNGTNVQVWQYAETNAQIFKLRTVKTLKGIDVSRHQGIINWNSVKNQGIEFAIIRIGFGKDDVAQDDEQFARNVLECERLGIPYGVYTYSYALTRADVDSEVNHVLRMISGKNPTLGVWIDMEDDDGYKYRNGGVIAENCVQICEEFCKQMESRGYKSGIYASKSWFETYLNDARLENNRKWVAQWNSSCTYTKSYDIWQYKANGIIDGIFGNVDMDYYYLRTEY